MKAFFVLLLSLAAFAANAQTNALPKAQDVEDNGGFTNSYYIEGNYTDGQKPTEVQVSPNQESEFYDYMNRTLEAQDQKPYDGTWGSLLHLSRMRTVCAVSTKRCDDRPAYDNIDIFVDQNYKKSGETLTFVADGHTLFTSTTSTGRAGYRTPDGSFRVARTNGGRIYSTRNHCSGVARFGHVHKGVVYLAPMPYTVHFNGGIAMHSGERVTGAPASHGCVRLPMQAAREVYCTLLSHDNWKRATVHVMH